MNLHLLVNELCEHLLKIYRTMVSMKDFLSSTAVLNAIFTEYR